MVSLISLLLVVTWQDGVCNKARSKIQENVFLTKRISCFDMIGPYMEWNGNYLEVHV